MSLKRFSVFALMIFAIPLFAQSVRIDVTVKDVNTHREIAGVNIFIEGGKGTVTNSVGHGDLSLQKASPNDKIVFQHIGYHKREISIAELNKTDVVYLSPRVIPLQSVEVEGVSTADRIKLDLPQSVQVMDAKNFEIRGFIDAGDLLKTDHSVQVEEQLTGRKTMTIRGGNEDEVVVLYNGVKLNSSLDNIFDMSLIDLEDVEKVEVVKGSNTAIYGPDAFAGVVNIVPKVDVDYTLRFQQRLGTYRSGNWGAHFHQRIGNLSGYYSHKQGGLERKMVGDSDAGVLENFSKHHNVNLTYDFSSNQMLSAMVVYTDLDYGRTGNYEESVQSQNTLASLRYLGNIGPVNNLDVSTSFKVLSENQYLVASANNFDRIIDDESLHLSIQKSQDFKRINVLMGYQLQQSTLDYDNVLTSYSFDRMHHGLLAIAKMEDQPGSDFFQNMKLSLSLRHDIVQDKQTDFSSVDPEFLKGSNTEPFEDKNWHESTAKIAMNLHGYRDDLVVDSYVSFGANVKFPTLLQQLSTPNEISLEANRPSLEPEKNRSVELTTTITKDLGSEKNVSGYQASATYFQNFYDNKFRTLTAPGFLIPFYDNVRTANIKGIEGGIEIFLLGKKITAEYGVSRYFVSEKSAFPFKSDVKHTINLNVDHRGYAAQLHWFREGDQVGWLRGLDNLYSEIELDGYSNIDFHISKSLELFRMKYFFNVSGRNLIKDTTVLEGLAIRDRRFYITFGAQF